MSGDSNERSYLNKVLPLINLLENETLPRLEERQIQISKEVAEIEAEMVELKNAIGSLSRLKRY